MVLRIALLVLALLPGMAAAATVDVTVRGADGAPLKDAVVLIDSPKAHPAPIRFDWPYEMSQQNISFQPHVLIVPVGATVTFPNRDKVRHHVYSASRIAKFDFKLYGRTEIPSRLFDRAGAVALGCNIHDAMSGFIYVTATPFAAKTDATGRIVISGVPAGGATLRVWHPMQRAPNNEMSQAVTIPAGGLTTTVTARTQ
jgi:plastocyanin